MEFCKFYPYMPFIDHFPQDPSYQGDGMPLDDTTPTAESAPAGTTTEETASTLEGLFADPTEDAADATDADLLEALSNDHPNLTLANLEQDGPTEAQTLA